MTKAKETYRRFCLRCSQTFDWEIVRSDTIKDGKIVLLTIKCPGCKTMIQERKQ